MACEICDFTPCANVIKLNSEEIMLCDTCYATKRRDIMLTILEAKHETAKNTIHNTYNRDLNHIRERTQ